MGFEPFFFLLFTWCHSDYDRIKPTPFNVILKMGVYIETLLPPCFEFPRFHLLALLWKFPFSNIAQHDNPII